MAGIHLILDEFLAWDNGRQWAFGQVDCCLVPCDWIVWRGYPDIAFDLRGTYGDAVRCRAVVARHGGLVGFGNRLNDIGWLEIAHPVEGCVAVVGSSRVMEKQWGAIHHDGRWMVRTQEGMLSTSAHALKMWDSA